MSTILKTDKSFFQTNFITEVYRRNRTLWNVILFQNKIIETSFTAERIIVVQNAFYNTFVTCVNDLISFDRNKMPKLIRYGSYK